MNLESILKRLREIESRAEKATPGPWVHFYPASRGAFAGEIRREGPVRIAYTAPTGAIVAERWGIAKVSEPEYYNLFVESAHKVWKQAVECTRNDGEFIARAREDVPWMLQVVRELLAQCAAMREALEAALSEISEALDEQLCDAAGERATLPIERQMMKALQPDAGRDLLDRLHKLEKVAEAAREYLHDVDAFARDEPTIYQYEPGEDKTWRLRKALAALEEGEDGA